MTFRTTISMALGCLALAAGGADAAPFQKAPMLKAGARLEREAPTQTLPAVMQEKSIAPYKRAATKQLDPAVGGPASPTGKPSEANAPILVPANAPTPSAPVSPADDGCRDPQAAELRVSGISRNADNTWQFSLIGTVRNGGDAAFRSRPDQQSAAVWEGSSRRAVGHFTHLNPGQRTNTTPTRVTRWSTGQEFHEGFKLRVDYDPDIFIDGNEQNDDCQLRNNEIILSAAEIDAILLRSGR